MRSAVRHAPALTLMGLTFVLPSRSDLARVEGGLDGVGVAGAMWVAVVSRPRFASCR